MSLEDTGLAACSGHLHVQVGKASASGDRDREFKIRPSRISDFANLGILEATTPDGTGSVLLVGPATVYCDRVKS